MLPGAIFHFTVGEDDKQKTFRENQGPHTEVSNAETVCKNVDVVALKLGNKSCINPLETKGSSDVRQHAAYNRLRFIILLRFT